MSRGQKLDLFIGANIADGWSKVADETTTNQEILEPSKHSLYFSKEKRNGKIITLVGEFFISETDAKTLLSKIKKKLGCGGAYKDGFMEFQGELKDKLRAHFIEGGFKFKPKH